MDDQMAYVQRAPQVTMCMSKDEEQSYINYKKN